MGIANKQKDKRNKIDYILNAIFILLLYLQ